jgi:hypothetical protein
LLPSISSFGEGTPKVAASNFNDVDYKNKVEKD